MAGTLVILHRRDDSSDKQKNQTRNLGLQSIIHREDTMVGLAITEANTYKAYIQVITELMKELEELLNYLVEVCNTIYKLMMTAYMCESNTTGAINITNGAMEAMRRTI